MMLELIVFCLQKSVEVSGFVFFPLWFKYFYKSDHLTQCSSLVEE